MKLPVSVILPHYNALSTIERSIDSVLSQTKSVGEIIVVDDASSQVDELLQLLSKYDAVVSMKIICLDSNSGASFARNAGVSQAKFKYIAFLDSDDVWHPKKIELQYDFMESNNAFLSGHGYVFDLNVEGYGDFNSGFESITNRSFLLGNPFFTPTVMAIRDGFVQFDERFRRVDDYKCWYENLCNGEFYILKNNLAAGFKVPIGQSGLSGSVKGMHLAYLGVLKSLYAEKKMPISNVLIAWAVESLKYPVRLILSRLKVR